MNDEINTIVANHLENRARAHKHQKYIYWGFSYVAPILASGLFLLILGAGFYKYHTNITSLLLVMVASLCLPLWVIMPLLQATRSKHFTGLDRETRQRWEGVVGNLQSCVAAHHTTELAEMLHANTTPWAWWDELEKSLRGPLARQFVQRNSSRSVNTPQRSEK